jgi:hypothetical protein
MDLNGSFDKDCVIDDKTIEGCYKTIITSLEYNLNGILLKIIHSYELNWLEHIPKHMKVEQMLDILEKASTFEDFEYYPSFNCPQHVNILGVFIDFFAEYISEDDFNHYVNIDKIKLDKDDASKYKSTS